MPIQSMSVETSAELIIDEHLQHDGVSQRTYLSYSNAELQLRSDGGLFGALPVLALTVVMGRYAKPLDDSVVAAGAVLELPGGTMLQMLRFRAEVDACARDYLVLRVPGAPPVAALSTQVASALGYLIRAQSPSQ